MPPRRSTRAASAQPTTAAAEKPAAKPVKTLPARTRAKRAVSPDRAPSPPAKRTRSGGVRADAKSDTSKPVVTKAVPSKPRARSRSVPAVKKPQTTSKPTATKKALSPVREVPQQKPYFNPLPTPPEHLRPSLQLFVWGAGNFGQFGMGSNFLGEFGKPRLSPWVKDEIQEGTFGEEGAGLEAIAAGGLHTLFIDEKGTVWSCGVNDDAALGRITKDVPDPNNPGQFLDVDELTAVPHPLQTLINEKFRAVKITAGDSISAAISAEGELRVWGSFRANEGSLGFASGLKHQFLPTSILELDHKPGDIEKVVDFAAGNNHLLVLTTHGSVFCWGSGEQGQLGHKIIERRKIGGTVPYKITLGTRTRKAVVVGAGNYHSFAVDEEGDVWGWGLNTMGQTGTGMSNHASADSEVLFPKKVIGLSKEELSGDTVVQIVGGEHHTLFRTREGKVYACGRADGGQLGLPKEHEAFVEPKHPGCVPEPAPVALPDEDDSRVVHVSVGTHNNMAITDRGALYAWGEGTQGELGTGDEGDAPTPTVIVRKEGGSWSAIAASCGGQHTLGLFRKKT